MKYIIMPCDSMNKKIPDSMFQKEFETAKKYFNVILFSLEDFLSFGTLDMVKPASSMEEVIYHGWMMSIENYSKFYNLLLSKNYSLINDARQYSNCHHFDNWYKCIYDLTPKSLVINSSNIRELLDGALLFQQEVNSPLIIKDAVKSMKHDWYEACFIPNDGQPFNATKVINAFVNIKLLYEDLKLPIVFRKFEKLAYVCKHDKSDMPVSIEYRTFVYKGKVIFQTKYWDFDYPNNIEPDQSLIDEIIARVSGNLSNFFTIDTALKQDGTWTCIEIGDAQVSSLPDSSDQDKFFKNLLM